MSLYKQLWLAIVLLLITVLGVSSLITTYSARSYLEEQLSIKNADNATALALSLSQQGADDVLLELTLSAQFDTGFYQMIELLNPKGQATLRRIDDNPDTGAPLWFVKMFPIEAEPGVAAIQSGWEQAGSLTVLSHSRFAYEELWYGTLRLGAVFLAACLLACFLGSLLLKRILLPLGDVMHQAEEIKQRKFITIDEPSTLEFKQLVNAMNSLSAHMKSLLSKEAKRLQKWQHEANVDKVTGLRNREPFVNELESLLLSDDANASGVLIIVRISDLSRLNQHYGRVTIDSFLRDIGKQLNQIVLEQNGWAAGRLNGSDIGVLAPRELSVDDLGNQIQQAIYTIVESHGLTNQCLISAAATIYNHNENRSELLTRVDGALASAQREKSGRVSIAFKGDISVKPVREQMSEWREILEKSLLEDRFSLREFPVLDTSENLIHFEAPVCLNWKQETLSAGKFLPWVNRLQFSMELDKRVVELALQSARRFNRPIAINLTGAALSEKGFMSWLEQVLSSQSSAARHLSLEIPESLVFKNLPSFKRLCARAKRFEVHMGIEHVGHQLAELGQLHDVGLDYLKVDAAFIREIQNNPGNQTLISALCTLGHTIGVKVIAEGVHSQAEWDALKELGVDGATGPIIKLLE
jgi:EAL domain-containing protein (putative c-di-GMP-specific phosphodiesterase class I)/GGDEF domain-containing protein